MATGWDAILSSHSHFQSLKSLASFVSCLCWHWSPRSSFWLCFPFIIFIIPSVDLFPTFFLWFPILLLLHLGQIGFLSSWEGQERCFLKCPARELWSGLTWPWGQLALLPRPQHEITLSHRAEESFPLQFSLSLLDSFKGRVSIWSLYVHHSLMSLLKRERAGLSWEPLVCNWI